MVALAIAQNKTNLKADTFKRLGRQINLQPQIV